MTADTVNAVAHAVGRAVIDRLFDRCVLDLSTGCLLWTGYTNKDGHGQFRVGRKVVVVSRLMWELTNHRPIPPGFIVRHRCDNPPCCEPTHLELGTHEDNVNDRVERGRSASGTRNGRTKLTESVVAAIRCRHGEPVKKLAREFNVNPRAIRAILAGETWKDVKAA